MVDTAGETAELQVVAVPAIENKIQIVRELEITICDFKWRARWAPQASPGLH
jgi:hypothetical protein